MSGSSITAGMLRLLSENPTTPPLAEISTQYRRIGDATLYPRLEMLVRQAKSVRQYGGGITPGALGTKQTTYVVVSHITYYGSDAQVDGAAFDTLVDQVEALYDANPWLAHYGDTTTSEVLNFAESRLTTRIPPDFSLSPDHVLYQAAIEASVDERINV